jgi:hypothetical protein
MNEVLCRQEFDDNETTLVLHDCATSVSGGREGSWELACGIKFYVSHPKGI